MPKPAVAALLIVAAIAVAVVLLVGGGDPGDTGLGETGTTAPTGTSSASASASTGEPAPLHPATVSTATSTTGGPAIPATLVRTPAGNGGAASGGAGHQVAAGDRITGVVRGPGGIPAAGATVLLTVQTAEGPKIRNGRTGHDGRFEIVAPGGGSATVQVQASGLATVAKRVQSSGDVVVDPPPAVQVAGFVRDGQGQPLAGAFVTAEEIGVPVVPARAIAQTDAKGAFALGALRRDARYRLTATHPSLAPSEAIEVTAPAVGAALTLFEGATLIIKVFDADGGVLSAGSTKSQQPGWKTLHAFAEVHGPGGSRTFSNWTTSNPEQIELTGLAAGEYRVILQVRGHGKAEKSGIAVPRSGTVEAEVRLTRGGFVVVTVVNEQGAPVPGAMVADAAQAGSAFGMLVQDETGAEGAGRVGPMPAGAQRVSASRPGFVTGFADVQVQTGVDSTARIVLKAP